MENPLPSRETLIQTTKEVIKFIGKAMTGRAFVPEHSLSSHGDHYFEHPLDTPVEPVTSLPNEVGICPDVAGRDL